MSSTSSVEITKDPQDTNSNKNEFQC